MSGDFISLLGAVIGLVGSALVLLWEAIMLWTRRALIPWFQANFPFLADAVRDAFVALDRNLMSPLRAIVLDAWRKIRAVLLKVLQKIVVKASECLSEIESFIVRVIDGEKRVVRIVSETVVDWSELPPDVREQMLRSEDYTYNVDILALREQELSPLTQ